MGGRRRLLVAPGPDLRWKIDPGTRLRRRKPRSYLEWKTLARWDMLPAWEEDPPGYLLRRLREEAGRSQQKLAEQLGCSQQAVAQAERWQSNLTVRFVREWARALGVVTRVSFERRRPHTAARDNRPAR